MVMGSRVPTYSDDSAPSPIRAASFAAVQQRTEVHTYPSWVTDLVQLLYRNEILVQKTAPPARVLPDIL